MPGSDIVKSESGLFTKRERQLRFRGVDELPFSIDLKLVKQADEDDRHARDSGVLSV